MSTVGIGWRWNLIHLGVHYMKLVVNSVALVDHLVALYPILFISIISELKW